MVDSNTEMEKAVSWFVIVQNIRSKFPLTFKAGLTGEQINSKLMLFALVKISQLKESNVKEIKVNWQKATSPH